MTKRLVKALAPAPSIRLEGAKVTAVGTGVVDLDLAGAAVSDASYLDTGWTPAVDDVVAVLVAGSRVLVLGPTA